MKRKSLIFVLILVLLVSMFPVTAHAAATMKPTNSCIDLIKKLEGFAEKPYWDYKQYSVGYGTRCPDDKLEEYTKNGITKAEAQKLLEEHLENYVDSVNKFAKKYDLNFTQAQFDALVSFTYNVGPSWTNGASTQMFTKAVLNGTTGNEFLAIFGLWTNADGKTSEGLVQRRLKEANMYLNGVYSNVIPTNYNYVRFNHSTSKFLGATRTIRVLCYDSKLGAPDMPQGTKSGYRFLGWYTKSSGGEWVDRLDDSHDGKKLYVHWQKDEGEVDGSGNILGTAAAYTRIASGDLKIHAQPKTSAKTTGSLKKGAAMNIVADYITADNVKWGLLKQGGWVCLSDTKNENEPVTPPAQEQNRVIATGTVSASVGTLCIRAEASTSSSVMGYLQAGQRVEIYELKSVGSTHWGRIDKGWISLGYVDLDDNSGTETKPDETKPEEDKPADQVVAKGMVSLASGTLNVRAKADAASAVKGALENGDIVEFYEIVKVGSYQWGRMAMGWVRMDYVKLGEAMTLPIDTITARSGAGTGYSKISSYKKGDQFHVYETAVVGNAIWGHTDKGWINLTYAGLAEPVIATGKVTADSLTIRKGAGSSYDKVGTYKKGDTVKIYETAKSGSYTWGRTDKGWISLSNVKLDGEKEENNTSVARTGTVDVTGTLNVRKSAGTGYASVGTVKNGDKLTITRLKLVNGSPWGKISSGWVCLDHVKMDKPAAGAIALTMGNDLNIRKGAGTKYDVVGKYDKGVVVTISKIKTVDGTRWGQTDKGWVSMDYIL